MGDDPLYDFWQRFDDQDGPFATAHLGGGYILVAETLERRRSGNIAGNLMLNNGRVVYQDFVQIDSDTKRQRWAAAAAKAAGDGGPTVDQLVEAILQELLPDAMERLAASESEKAGADAGQTDQMIHLVTGDIASDALEAGAELFHDPTGEAFATVPVGGHQETWPLRSRGFRTWARRLYFEHFKRAPRAQAVNDAIEVLDGRALFDGPEHTVHVRLAEADGVIFLDLGDPEWQVAMIGPSGWQIITQPPVKFRRPAGLLPLPVPARGGSLDDLRPFLNVESDADWFLVVAWVLAALRPSGPYPPLVFSGEQGSAKSSMGRRLRGLIDPNTAAIRSMPRSDHDLVIAGRNGWVMCFDNVSHIPVWLSDGLCRVSTGGGFATRQLYTDSDEVLIDVKRPIILNGITEVATRPDLIDRSLIVTLPPIPDDKRREEADLERAFAQVQPGILGALLDVVSGALRALPETKLAARPRMADFATWLVAAEPSLGWESGSFLAAYTANRREANALALESSPVAAAVRELMTGENPAWDGTATELLAALDARVTEKVQKQKGWPKAANALSHTLKRLAPNLRADGIEISFEKQGRDRVRTIRLQWQKESCKSSSASSTSSATPKEPRNDGFFDADDDADDHAKRSSAGPSAPKTPPNQGFSDNADDVDDADDLLQPSLHPEWRPDGDGGDNGDAGGEWEGGVL